MGLNVEYVAGAGWVAATGQVQCILQHMCMPVTIPILSDMNLCVCRYAYTPREVIPPSQETLSFSRETLLISRDSSRMHTYRSTLFNPSQ